MTEAQKKSVVIVGATAGIGRCAAQAFAARGYALALGARDDEENARVARDIATRTGVTAVPLHFDAEDYDSHAAFLADCERELGGAPEGLVFFVGYLADQRAAEKDFALARRTIDVNLTTAISLIERFAAQCEARRHGFIGIVSSVAGDRGRQSNYLYGAAKAGLSAYAQGLRNRLYPAGVTVTTLKPGFVDTKMTWGMNTPKAITASPEAAGQAICDAVLAGKNVAYVLWFWRYIMLIIRAIPEWQFKKMKL